MLRKLVLKVIYEVKEGNYNIYKLNIDNEEIGFIETIHNIDYLEITDVLIYEKYRSKGYSKLLMDYIFNNTKYNRFLLEVSINNKIAISLYKKYNFKEISVRKNYYKDGSDALIMEVVR